MEKEICIGVTRYYPSGMISLDPNTMEGTYFADDKDSGEYLGIIGHIGDEMNPSRTYQLQKIADSLGDFIRVDHHRLCTCHDCYRAIFGDS